MAIYSLGSSCAAYEFTVKGRASKFLTIGAILGFLGVAVGAFGAHGLKSMLAPEMLAVFETGVRYHMYHALAVLVAGRVCETRDHPLFCYAAGAFILGIVLFSGSLYVLSVTEVRWLGAITPLGGVMFLIGWLLLGIGFVKSSPTSS